MVTSRERIQAAAGGGKETVTPAPTETDQDGILNPLTSFQIERLSCQQVLDYQQRRAEQIAEKEGKEAEGRDFESYRERYLAAGGRETSARAAFDAHRDEVAAAQARSADQEAIQAARSRNRKVL